MNFTYKLFYSAKIMLDTTSTVIAVEAVLSSFQVQRVRPFCSYLNDIKSFGEASMEGYVH